MNTVNSQTDTEFDDISSFSSIDSYKPEPFRGVDYDAIKHGEGGCLIKNDTIIRHSGDYSGVAPEMRRTISNANTDINSKASSITLKKLDSNAIDRVVTQNALGNKSETVESLKVQGLDLNKAYLPDINSPMTHASGDSAFPDEYRIETSTGLVKMKTLESLKKENTRNSSSKSSQRSKKSKSSDGRVSQAQKMELAVEKNRKELEKYQKHKNQKGVKGFFNRMFD